MSKCKAVLDQEKIREIRVRTKEQAVRNKSSEDAVLDEQPPVAANENGAE